MAEALLALDLGTSSCKAVLFTPTGTVLGVAATEYATHHPQPGAAEQEAADWWDAAVSAARTALAAAGEGVEVLAIGLSSQRETVVPVNGRGEPLRRALTWMDRRAQPQAAALAAVLGAQQVHARTGMLPEATFTGAKLRWLTEHEPETVQAAAAFLQPKDYLLLRLTGAPAIDPSLASRTLLWGIHDGWQADLLEWAGIRASQLPPVVPSGAVAGHLTPAAAAALGLRPGIPVAAGAGDRCCEALAAGVEPGRRVMVSTGTATNVSGALATLPDPLVSGILYTRHSVPGQWLAEQGISTGGSVLRWLRDTLRRTGYDELNAAAAAAPPGAGGLLLLPFFMGARATRWNPAARGAWLGLTLGHGEGELARSVMEGVACEVRACLEKLAQAGQPAADLMLLGGGAQSPLWCQIKADVTGRTIAVPALPHAGALGAMLLAGQAVGLWSDPVAASRQVAPVASQFTPDPARMPVYDRLYSVYNRLYDAVAPLYEELAALAAGEE